MEFNTFQSLFNEKNRQLEQLIENVNNEEARLVEQEQKIILLAQDHLIGVLSAASMSLGASIEFPKKLSKEAVPVGYKKCSCCESTLPLNKTNFSVDRSKACGFKSRCKRCLQEDRVKKKVMKNKTRKRGVGEGDLQENNNDDDLDALATVALADDDDDDVGGDVGGDVVDGSDGDQKYVLHRDGFEIHKNMLEVGSDVVDLLLHYSDLQRNIIFNNDIDDVVNDNLRSTTQYPSDNSTLNNFREDIGRVLSDIVGSFNTKRAMRDMTILRSQSGCKDQLPHTDYIAGDLERVLDYDNDDDMPLSCIVVCMDNTYLNVWPGAIKCFNSNNDGNNKQFECVRLNLNAGDVLIFRGDLVHAGSAYDEKNVRIHVYLDSKHVNTKKSEDRTFLMDDQTCPKFLPPFPLPIREEPIIVVSKDSKRPKKRRK